MDMGVGCGRWTWALDMWTRALGIFDMADVRAGLDGKPRDLGLWVEADQAKLCEVSGDVGDGLSVSRYGPGNTLQNV